MKRKLVVLSFATINNLLENFKRKHEFRMLFSDQNYFCYNYYFRLVLLHSIDYNLNQLNRKQIFLD